ncbi:hypothetical protein VN24_06810 [Paenibacillus beijingensis]|uniref:ABC transporter substrate-binding protein n=1 Tax=Paenibacillus beijingensis TaxID=1126833 RepID=A0A0D5NH93_9BACL|nr:hypothetical protein VN24_06810 [Paenibacillus beijingensis]
MLTWNEQTFNQKYGNLFLATHPNYDLNVISVMEHLKPGEDINQVVESLVTKENPDLLSLQMDLFAVLKEQGRLASFTDWIKKDKFDLTGYTPGVLDQMKDEQGHLYGLAPTFVGSALYYNKKLFETNNIPFPTDLMTWDDVFAVAQRFPNKAGSDTPQIGFYHPNSSNPFLMALRIGDSSGLSLYNAQKFTLSTKAWEGVFQNVTECFKAQACFDGSHADTSQTTSIEVMQKRNHPFLGGNIAMAIDDSSLYRTLLTNKQRYPDLDWGIVSFPISNEHPDMGNNIALNEVLSIPLHAKEPEGAWEFINYVCGADYARMLPRVNPDELPARQSAGNEDDMLGSFYKLERVNNQMTNKLRELPRPVIAKMDEVSQTYIPDILADKTTVSEALQMMEQELQLALATR